MEYDDRRKVERRLSSAEKSLLASLMVVCRQIGRIIRWVGSERILAGDDRAYIELLRYSKQLEPWARLRSEELVVKLERQAMRMSGFRRIDGSIAINLIRDLVIRITGIPLSAAERIKKLMVSPGSDVLMVESQEDVSISRSNEIARTEVSRTYAVFTASIALSMGNNHYIWRTMRDDRVRHSHRLMEGQLCSFLSPPEVGDEGRHGPGEVYNCRCWAETYKEGKSGTY